MSKSCWSFEENEGKKRNNGLCDTCFIEAIKETAREIARRIR